MHRSFKSPVISLVASLSALALGACTPPPPANDSGVDSGVADSTTNDATTDSASPDVVSPTDAMNVMDVTDATTDSGVATDTGTGSDSQPDSSADAADAATESGADGGTGCPLTRVIATTSDGTEGAYVTGDVATRTLAYQPPPMSSMVEQDHVVRRAGCRVYDLWRSFGAGPNEIVELDPANPYMPRRRITVPPVPMVGAPNPYDVVEISPTKSYLLLYNSPNVWVFNPQTGAMSGTIDLSAFAGTDGIPEATAIHVYLGRAWVALQQLDRMAGYAPPARSTVVAIDTATDTLADLDAAMPGVQSSVSLTYGNPQSASATPSGRLWLIASTGTFGNRMDGGIDVLDAMTGQLLAPVSAAMLGADPGSITTVSLTTAWVATRPSVDGGSVTRVLPLTIGAMTTVGAALFNRPEPLSDMQLGPDGNVWALNGSFGTNGAVYVFRPDGTSLSTFNLPARGDAGSTGTYSLAFAP